MPLSPKYKVDFSGLEVDLVQQALGRMLSQHLTACVLRQFVAVLVRECQELYDACLQLQEMRTPYQAESENLNALGRIVGADRAPWQYDDSYWFFFDRMGQGTDETPMWCLHAPMEAYVAVDDEQYRLNIILKAIKNHTLVGSIPEVISFIKQVMDLDVSYAKTGPNQVRIIVPENISTNELYLLVRSWSDSRVDHAFMMPYPATLDFNQVVFVPDEYFCFDREERPTDFSPMAVAVAYPWEN